MTPKQKSEIKRQCNALFDEEFPEFELRCEWAHQMLDDRDRVLGVANNELRNALSDARSARHCPTYNAATRALSRGRRHFYRARWFYISSAVKALEAHIFRWIRKIEKRKKKAQLAEWTKCAKELRKARLAMPDLPRAKRGGTFAQIEAGTARIGDQIRRWQMIFLRLLQLYDAMIV